MHPDTQPGLLRAHGPLLQARCLGVGDPFFLAYLPVSFNTAGLNYTELCTLEPPSLGQRHDFPPSTSVHVLEG